MSEQGLRDRYKQLVLRHHPDKVPPGQRGDPDAFHDVQVAYRALNEHMRRQRDDGGRGDEGTTNRTAWCDAGAAWVVLVTRSMFPPCITVDVDVKLGDLLEGGRFQKIVYRSRQFAGVMPPLDAALATRMLIVPLDVHRAEAVYTDEGDVGFTGVAGGLRVRSRIVDSEGAAVTHESSPTPGDLYHTRTVTPQDVLSGELRFTVPITPTRHVNVTKRFCTDGAAAWDDHQAHHVVVGQGFAYETSDGDVQRGDLHIKFVLLLGHDPPPSLKTKSENVV
jgi:hypothetical protein